MSILDARRRVHVVGVGGSGMSGFATLLAEAGVVVSGCDRVESPQLVELGRRGVSTVVGHSPDHVTNVDTVIWSPAIANDSEELRAARERGVEMLSRARLFGELSRVAPVVGLCGTHGKTTATSMMVHVSLADGRDDGWLLGAPVLGVGGNGHWGSADVVVEVDESYGTFSEIEPDTLGVLNIEADHLDHYGSLERLEEAFAALVARTRGPVVAWTDDAGVARMVTSSRRDVVGVGYDGGAAWRVSDVELGRRHSSFTLHGPAESLRVSLRVTGAHNVSNAAVVATLARLRGVESSAVIAGLGNFLGAPRRYQYRGAWRGVDVYEDYAHLPGEISVTLEAAHAAGYERVGAIFQPHRVTRTLALTRELAVALADAHRVVVTDIYPAGEENPTGVTGEVVAAALRDVDPTGDVRYIARLEDVVVALDRVLAQCDVVLILGAGDVASILSVLPGGPE